MTSHQHLFFRFGFALVEAGGIAIRSRVIERKLCNWQRHEFSGYTLFSHPEIPVTVLRDGPKQLAVIGHVYSESSRSVGETLDVIMSTSDTLQSAREVEQLCGRYALFIASQDGLLAFHDPFGSRAVYYSLEDEAAIASHPELLAEMLGLPFSNDAYSMILSEGYQKRRVKYFPGLLTCYDNVYTLAPNNCLDIRAGRQKRYWPHEPVKSSTVPEAADAVIKSVETLGKYLKCQGHIPVLGITGGTDTRAILAVFCNSSIEFRCVSWDDSFYRPQQERSIATEVYKCLNLAPRFIQTRLDKKESDAAVGAYYAALRSCAGFTRTPSHLHLAAAMASEFGTDPSLVFIRGYGGEIIRGFYQKLRPIKKYSGRGFARLYGTRMGSTYVRSAFEHFVSEANYSEELTELGYDVHDLFYWEHRMGMWGATMINAMDPAMYSMVGFNSRAAYAAGFGVDLDKRLEKKIQKAVIEKLNPKLAAIESA